MEKYQDMSKQKIIFYRQAEFQNLIFFKYLHILFKKFIYTKTGFRGRNRGGLCIII